MSANGHKGYHPRANYARGKAKGYDGKGYDDNKGYGSSMKVYDDGAAACPFDLEE